MEAERRRIEKARDDYESKWTDFLNLVPCDDDIVKHEMQAHYQIMSQIPVTLLECDDAIANANAHLPTNNVPNANSPTRTPVTRMPKIELPEFFGVPEEWEGFWDIYAELVHNNSSIPTTTKFAYLRQALKGKALDAIHGFKTTLSDYDNAISMLKSLFVDKEKVVDQLFYRFLKRHPIKK